MACYRIAELTVDMEPRYDLLKRRAEKYRVSDDCQPDIVLRLSDDYLEKKRATTPHISLEEHEYIWMGAAFSGQLWKYDAMTIHASAVALDDRAYLFSAQSGVGKTTHTKLWLRRFPDAFIIDDDHPVVRLENGRLMVHGTPFSGNSDENRNVKRPLASLVFIQRDTNDWIRRLTDKEAAVEIYRNIGVSRKPEAVAVKLNLMDHMTKTVLLCQMGCTMHEHAADVAYHFIEENRL